MHFAKGLNDAQLLLVVDPTGIARQSDGIDEAADLPIIKILTAGEQKDDENRLVAIGGATIPNPHPFGGGVDEEMMKQIELSDVADGLHQRHHLHLRAIGAEDGRTEHFCRIGQGGRQPRVVVHQTPPGFIVTTLVPALQIDGEETAVVRPTIQQHVTMSDVADELIPAIKLGQHQPEELEDVFDDGAEEEEGDDVGVITEDFHEPPQIVQEMPDAEEGHGADEDEEAVGGQRVEGVRVLTDAAQRDFQQLPGKGHDERQDHAAAHVQRVFRPSADGQTRFVVAHEEAAGQANEDGDLQQPNARRHVEELEDDGVHVVLVVALGVGGPVVVVHRLRSVDEPPGRR